LGTQKTLQQQPNKRKPDSFNILSFNNHYVDFNNPTTTPKPKTQSKTKNQTKTQLVENDPYCQASTTTKEKNKIGD
jgi:hypothetical protein